MVKSGRIAQQRIGVSESQDQQLGLAPRCKTRSRRRASKHSGAGSRKQLVKE